MRHATLIPAIILAVLPAVASAQTPLTTRLVANGIAKPLWVTAPPGDYDRIFVLEQDTARVRIIQGGLLLATPFLDINPIASSGGERGLLGMAFHPDYLNNGFFWLYYTNNSGQPTIARYHVTADPNVADPLSASILLSIPHPSFANHNGGWIQFSPADGHLYFGTGDGGSANDPPGNAQNINVRLGKILRIDPTLDNVAPFYNIPPTNPFAGAIPGLDEIYAIGIRNPWRPSFDRLTGDFWIADVGQGAHEEIDFQPASFDGLRNYGWRCMEGFSCTGLSGCTCNDASLTLPIFDYGHTGGNCSITGGNVYRGAAIPDLSGTYFFADYCSNQIWSLKYDGTNVTDFTNRTAELDPPGALSIVSITSFGQDSNGETYICDQNGGEVYQIVPATIAYNGVNLYGTGTWGCAGPEIMGTNMEPRIDSPGFKFTCTNVPANSLSLGLITNSQSISGIDLGLGILFHADPVFATELYTFDMVGNPFNFGTALVPIPNVAAAIGAHLQVQVICSETACTLPPFNLSSSNAIDLVFQP
ncbi:MAG TPA: PQQ-dependent sugar dehydrogenase [Planctomycetota bacterium]|nr:PQQ-dependent sugar dehydrogenase [Planctomycetota bacterium]